MKKLYLNNILLSISMSLVVTACGGSGGTSDNGSNPINTPDEVAPIITLNGSNNISILLNDNYQEPGAFANDAVDGSVIVTETGNVDTSTAGSYTITYNAMDAAGNAANEVTRTVTVIAGTPIATPQKLYGVDYDIYSGFEFSEITINETSLSAAEGEILNNAVTFPVEQGDLYYSAFSGEWVGRNPANFGFELAELNTVGVVDGVRKFTIEDIQPIDGQRLIVGGNEIDSSLPEGSLRYNIKTELLEDLYSVYEKVDFNGVVAQTLDEVLSNSCNTTVLVDYIDSDQLINAAIPCGQISQTTGTLTANTAVGGLVTDAGVWSVGKISGSDIDVLKITLNPSYLRANSDQLIEHSIFAIKDGEVWAGDLTTQGAVTNEVYYNETAISNRILNGCFVEDSNGNYVDC